MSAFGPGPDPLEVEKDPEEFSAWARLYSVEPADIRMNAFSVAFGGVKRTWAGAVHMSAYDPKRTRAGLINSNFMR